MEVVSAALSQRKGCGLDPDDSATFHAVGQCKKAAFARLATDITLPCFYSYRVGSANFSQRKIGHAHDNSADSENVQVLPNGVCTRISFFISKTVREIRAFFSIHDQNTAETSQPQAQVTDDWRAMNRACPRGLRRPLEKFDSARLSRKKKKQANFVNRRKFLLKGYNFKESKHDRFGKRPAANVAEKIDERSTEADLSAFRRPIGLLFFFYDRLRTYDLRFLLWMYLASILLERFRSARQKAITFFAAHFAESSLREELACGPVIELLHRSCNWLKLTERAARFPARASCAGSKVGAEKFAWACNPTRYGPLFFDFSLSLSLSLAFFHWFHFIRTKHKVGLGMAQKVQEKSFSRHRAESSSVSFEPALLQGVFTAMGF